MAEMSPEREVRVAEKSPERWRETSSAERETSPAERRWGERGETAGRKGRHHRPRILEGLSPRCQGRHHLKEN